MRLTPEPQAPARHVLLDLAGSCFGECDVGLEIRNVGQAQLWPDPLEFLIPTSETHKLAIKFSYLDWLDSQPPSEPFPVFEFS